LELKSHNSPPPLPDDLPAALRFYYQINHLKNLFRQGWLQAGIPRERCESVAEHCFGVALLCMLLAEAHFPDLDLERVLSMALLHDLGEVYAGDLTPQDGVDPDEKHRRESDAIERLFAGMPGEGAYIALWHEYERGESAEADFVRQIDRLEMGLQASVYAHEYPAVAERFFDSARSALSSHELLGIMDAVKRLQEG
jgi:putative hydrolase of HD superfamily